MSAAKTAEELSAARPVMIEQVAALVAANAEEFSKNGDEDEDEDEDPTFPRPSALGTLALTELLMAQATSFQRDIRCFTEHARRKQTTAADVLLLARKHPATLEALTRFKRAQDEQAAQRRKEAARKKQLRAGSSAGGSARKKQRMGHDSDEGEDEDDSDDGMSPDSDNGAQE